ncbi:MAG TPA: glycogen-binding domain-containing protein [Gemmatimonadaceae bacterium]|nr:glycogen-binding domain-containing protein [Gemmatimonadaceae bacterium]
MRRYIGVALAILASGLPARATAQALATLDANVAGATYDQYLPSAVYTVAPALSYAGDAYRVGLDGAFSAFQTGHTSGVGEFQGAVGTRIYGPLRWELSGDGSALWYRANPAVWSGVLTPSIHADHGPLDAWVNGALGSTNNDLVVGSFVDRVGGGVAYALPHITPSMTVQTTRAGIYHYTDVEGGIQGEVGRFGVTSTVGTRTGVLGGGVATWFNAEVRFLLVDRVSLVFSGGSYPVDLVHGAPGAHFIGGGIRVSQAFLTHKRAMPAVRYDPLNATTEVMPDARTLRFAAPPSAHVELMADFTDWKAVAMTEVQPGRYQITLPDAIRSGLHRVNIRVDHGEWRVPAELPSVVDDLGGTVGSLVVP